MKTSKGLNTCNKTAAEASYVHQQNQNYMKSTFFISPFFATFLLFSTATFAQSVSGTLVDKSSNKTIPFATVQLGDNYGVVTNQEGDFSINISGFSEADSLVFSSMGYDRKSIALKDFEGGWIYLSTNIEKLDEVLLLNKELTALEIMTKVNENLEKNYDFSLTKFTVFHRSKSTATPHQMAFDVKKADFIERKTLRQFNKTIDSLSKKNMGLKTSYYETYLANFAFGKEDSLKVHIEKATKLINERVSNNMEVLSKTVLENLVSKLQSSNTFSVRTGIIPIGDSLDLSKDFAVEENDVDSLKTESLGNNMENVLIKSLLASEGGSISIGTGGTGGSSFVSNYITEIDDYEYEIKDVSTFNGELIYIISFSPDSGLFSGNGIFTGTLYISADSFAVLKADYQLAEGEHGAKFNMKFLLGVKFNEKAKSGTLIYQKNGQHKYIPKYMRVSGEQYVYFSRNFVLKENDKNRNDRIKLKVEFTMEADNSYDQEWLFIGPESILEKEFANFKENKGIPVQQLSAYTPEIWKEYNILAPTEAIREYEY